MVSIQSLQYGKPKTKAEERLTHVRKIEVRKAKEIKVSARQREVQSAWEQYTNIDPNRIICLHGKNTNSTARQDKLTTSCSYSLYSHSSQISSIRYKFYEALKHFDTVIHLPVSTPCPGKSKAGQSKCQMPLD